MPPAGAPETPQFYTDFGSAPAGLTLSGVSVSGGRLTGTGTARTTANMPSDCVAVATWPVGQNGRVILRLRDDASGHALVSYIDMSSGYCQIQISDESGGSFSGIITAYNVTPDGVGTNYGAVTGFSKRLVGTGASAKIEYAWRGTDGLWRRCWTSSNRGLWTGTLGSMSGLKASLTLDGNVEIEDFGIYAASARLIGSTGFQPGAMDASSDHVTCALDGSAHRTGTYYDNYTTLGAPVVMPNMTSWPQVATSAVPGTDLPGIRTTASTNGIFALPSHGRLPSNDYSVRLRVAGYGGSLLSPSYVAIFKIDNRYDATDLGTNSSGALVLRVSGTDGSVLSATGTLPDASAGTAVELLLTRTGQDIYLFADDVVIIERHGLLPNTPKNLPITTHAWTGISLFEDGGSNNSSHSAHDLLVTDRPLFPGLAAPTARSAAIAVGSGAGASLPEFGLLHAHTGIPASDPTLFAGMLAAKVRTIRTDKVIQNVDYGTSSSTRTYRATGCTGYIDPRILARLVAVLDAVGAKTVWLGMLGTPQHVGGSAAPLTTTSAINDWAPGDLTPNPEVPTNLTNYADHWRNCLQWLKDNWTGKVIMSSVNEPTDTAFWVGTSAELANAVWAVYHDAVIPVQGANPQFILGEAADWDATCRARTQALLQKFHDQGVTNTAWNKLYVSFHGYRGGSADTYAISADVAEYCTALGRPALPVSNMEGFACSNESANRGFTATQVGQINASHIGAADMVSRLFGESLVGGLGMTYCPAATFNASDVYSKSGAFVGFGSGVGQRRPLANLVEAWAGLMGGVSKAVTLGNAQGAKPGLTAFASVEGSGASTRYHLLIGYSSHNRGSAATISAPISMPEAAGETLNVYRVSSTHSLGQTLEQDGTVTLDGAGAGSVNVPPDSVAYLATPAATYTVTIDDSTTTPILVSTTRTLAAGVSPSGSVTWSKVSGPVGASINAGTGVLTAGAAAGTVVVRATSADDPAAYDEASITITGNAVAAVIADPQSESGPAQSGTESWVVTVTTAPTGGIGTQTSTMQRRIGGVWADVAGMAAVAATAGQVIVCGTLPEGTDALRLKTVKGGQTVYSNVVAIALSEGGGGSGGSGLTTGEHEILERIAASVGAFGGLQALDGDVTTQTMNRPDGGTVTRSYDQSSGVLSITNAPAEPEGP